MVSRSTTGYTKVGDFGERELIKKFIVPMLDSSGGNPPLDDCAIFEIGNNQSLVISIDQGPSNPFLFKVGGGFEDLGHFHVTLNVSDIASMGVMPAGMLMVLAANSDFSVRDLEALLRGIQQGSEQYSVPLLGGDTKETQKLNITLAIFGFTESGKLLTRSGASPGDLVCVSGSIGETLSDYVNKYRDNRTGPNKIRRPIARLDIGQALVNSDLCTSCMDMSDGLFSSAIQLGELNQCTFEIEMDHCPLVFPAHLNTTDWKWLDFALNVGGDFELFFTLKNQRESRNFLEKNDCHVVGKVLPLSSEDAFLRIVGNDDGRISVAPWEHFKTIGKTTNNLESFL